MRLEFAGLPGAGKTTVASLLKRELESLGHETITNGDLSSYVQATRGLGVPRRYAHNFRALAMWVTSPRRMRHLWGAFRSDDPTYAYRRLKYLTSRVVAQEALSRGGECFILDQGLYQNLWALCRPLEMQAPGVFERLTGALADFLPDLCVILTVSPETAISRMKSRSGQGCELDRKPSREVEQLFEISAGLFDLIPHLQERHGKASISLSGEDGNMDLASVLSHFERIDAF